MAVTPVAAIANQSANIFIIEFGIENITIIFILIILCTFICSISIPAKTIFCSANVSIKTAQCIIGLILGYEICFYGSFGRRLLRYNINNAGDGITSIY